MPTFVKKPVEIEAFQFLPDDDSSMDDLTEWLSGANYVLTVNAGGAVTQLEVTTIHGEQAVVRPGDWVIAEPVRGRYYPCKPGIFETTYEEVA